MDALRTPLYIVEGEAFVRHNGEHFNNRPLYCNQISAIVVAGDKPLLRFGSGAKLDWKQDADTLVIHRVNRWPCQHAVTFKIELKK